MAGLAPVVGHHTDVYVELALLLLTAAPALFLFLVAAYTNLGQPLAHACTVSVLAALNLMAFGLPNPPHFPPGLSALAVLTAVAYYFIERFRIRSALPGAVRVSMPAPRSVLWPIAPVILVWSAIAEELLFRWYLICVPIARGWMSGAGSLVVSTVAFGFLHENFGAETMSSRMGFGLILGFVVLATGDLSFAFLAHGAYNALVWFFPVEYVNLRRG
ncbi:MAG TPA: CPBP family intramembrane glutamic endopeptidase [Bryobacteraceae bacterium]